MGNADLRAVLESLPIVTFTATAEGIIDWVSDRWYEATGIARDAVLGEAWVHIVHPDDIEHIVWLWTRSLEEGVPWEATTRVRCADGVYRWWFTRAERIVNAGEPPIWIGTTIELSGVQWQKIAAEPNPATG